MSKKDGQILKHMGLWVRRFQYLQNHVVELEFSNDEVRYVDFFPILNGSNGHVGEILKNGLFWQAILEDGTLLWPNGVDFDPDYLYAASESSLKDLVKN